MLASIVTDALIVTAVIYLPGIIWAAHYAYTEERRMRKEDSSTPNSQD